MQREEAMLLSLLQFLMLDILQGSHIIVLVVVILVYHFYARREDVAAVICCDGVGIDVLTGRNYVVLTFIFACVVNGEELLSLFS